MFCKDGSESHDNEDAEGVYPFQCGVGVGVCRVVQGSFQLSVESMDNDYSEVAEAIRGNGLVSDEIVKGFQSFFELTGIGR